MHYFYSENPICSFVPFFSDGMGVLVGVGPGLRPNGQRCSSDRSGGELACSGGGEVEDARQKSKGQK